MNIDEMRKVKKIILEMAEIDKALRCLLSNAVVITIEGKTINSQEKTVIPRDKGLIETMINYYNNKYDALYEELEKI